MDHFLNQRQLWWCFSKRDITLSEGGSRVGPATTKWSNHDVEGEPLSVDRLSGALVAVQGYRGTISKIGRIQIPYLVRRINATLPPLAQQARSSRNSLVQEIASLVGHLHWGDFELLVELLFGKVGWQRESSIGGTQKDLDLVFIAPVTAAKYGVQVKSAVQASVFREWESRVTAMEGFDRFYFLVHSPSKDLREFKTNGKVQFLGPQEIAEWSVKHGFVDWIIDRAG